MVYTKWSRFSNDELIRLVAMNGKLTELEAELVNRLIDLEDHVSELSSDSNQMDLPLQ